MKKGGLFSIFLLALSSTLISPLLASPVSSDDDDYDAQEYSGIQPLRIPLSVAQNIPRLHDIPPYRADDDSLEEDRSWRKQSGSLPDHRDLALFSYLRTVLQENNTTSILNAEPFLSRRSFCRTEDAKSHRNFSEDKRSMEALDLDGDQQKDQQSLLAKKVTFYKKRIQELNRQYLNLLTQLNTQRQHTSRLEEQLFWTQHQPRSFLDESSSTDEEDSYPHTSNAASPYSSDDGDQVLPEESTPPSAGQ